MIEVRSLLVPSLTTAINTATGLKVYDGLPIYNINTAVFPHVNISDIHIQEDGPKNLLQYKVNVLIEVCHNRITTLDTLYQDMNKILGFVNNGAPFAIGGLHVIMDCQLDMTTTTKAETEKGLVNVGVIRLIFRIQ